eukprot:2667222-Amphidinium_carterae.1
MAPKIKEAMLHSAESVLSQITHGGRVSASLCASETRVLIDLVAASVATMSSDAHEFLVEHVDNGVLVQYSQDCTPIRTKESVSARALGKRANRSGRITSDVGVQQVFLSGLLAEGGFKHRAIFGLAVPLAHKTSEDLAAMSLRQPGLRLLSNRDVTGFRVIHQVYDRAIGQDVADFISGLVQSCSDDEGVSVSGIQGDRSELRVLHTFTNCSCHDAHNALKWSYQAQFPSSDLLKLVYAGIASMRVCSMGCLAHIGDWLLDVVRPRIESEC